MDITQTTMVGFSLQQFVTIVIFIIMQTIAVVGLYWKQNIKIKDVDKKADDIQRESNHQYSLLEKAQISHESNFKQKCSTIEKESDLKFSAFNNVIEMTNKTLSELNSTVKELNQLVTSVSKEIGEHKAYHYGKEDKQNKQGNYERKKKSTVE